MLAFSKFEALGNDFMLVDARHQAFDPFPRQIARLGDRRFGVGFDQLLIVRADSADRFRVDIYNQDGSPAEQCGNGMRAVALFLRQHANSTPAGELLTAAGPVQFSCPDAERIRVSLPSPGLARPGSDWHATEIGEAHGDVLCGGPDFISMGNPHIVLELKHPPDDLLLQDLGRRFNLHPALPDGANVNLAQVVSPDQVELKVFERGVGPTLACGSGACATAVSLIQRGRVNRTLTVNQPGGSLVIHWLGDEHPIVMTGPARRVFDGQIDLGSL